MKPGAVVLNFSRDGIVDEDAIVEALRSGQCRSTSATSRIRSSPGTRE